MLIKNVNAALIAAVLVLLVPELAYAQSTANNNVDAGDRVYKAPEQLDDKDPNRIVYTHFRLRGEVTQSQSDFSIPVRLWPTDCARCELLSNITENTEVLESDGEPKPIHTLKPNRTYTAIAVQYNAQSVKEIEKIQLVPSR